MSARVRLGPLCVAIEGASQLGPTLDALRVEAAADFTVTVHEQGALDAPDGNGFESRADDPLAAAVMPYDARWPGRGLLAWLTEVVASAAPARGASVLHAAALDTPRGVVGLVGAPGVGKTTLVRARRARARANNALWVEVAGEGLRAWALPFAGDPDASLDAPAAFEISAWVRVEAGWAETPQRSSRFEWQHPGRATPAMMRSLIRPRRGAFWSKDAWQLGLRCLTARPVGRLVIGACDDALRCLDAACETAETRP
ncbi:MAG: hypothetical protein JNK72_19830 [Myxococcales bacterium]|nr:hypothetical protein [Myxococcales bacterium]